MPFSFRVLPPASIVSGIFTPERSRAYAAEATVATTARAAAANARDVLIENPSRDEHTTAPAAAGVQFARPRGWRCDEARIRGDALPGTRGIDAIGGAAGPCGLARRVRVPPPPGKASRGRLHLRRRRSDHVLQRRRSRGLGTGAEAERPRRPV